MNAPWFPHLHPGVDPVAAVQPGEPEGCGGETLLECFEEEGKGTRTGH